MGKKSKRSGRPAASHPPPPVHVLHNKDVCKLVDELWERTQALESTSLQSLWGELQAVHHYTKQIVGKQGPSPAPLPERGEALVAMESWLREQGVCNETVEIAKFPVVGYGLKAKRDIKQEEKVMMIPRKLMMTLTTAKEGPLGALIAQDRILQLMPNVTLAMHLLNERYSTNSFWKPYIDSLPHEYTTPFFYHKDDLKELQSSPCLVKAIVQIRNVSKLYAHLHRLVRTTCDPSLPLFEAGFFLDDFLWAVSAVMSRQNEIPEKADGSNNVLALIPLWDLCNHTEGHMSTFYNLEEGTCDCYALEDTPTGEEFLIFYGSRANYDLLIHQGFVFMRNKSDALQIRLGLSTDDLHYDGRKKILEKLNIPIGGEFSVYCMECPFSQSLVAFTRVFTATAEELEGLLIMDQEQLTGTLFNDRWSGDNRVLSFLLIRCQILLRSYTTSLDQDAPLLDKLHTFTPYTQLAIQIRICEKRILHNAVAYARRVGQQLEALKVTQEAGKDELKTLEGRVVPASVDRVGVSESGFVGGMLPSNAGAGVESSTKCKQDSNEATNHPTAISDGTSLSSDSDVPRQDTAVVAEEDTSCYSNRDTLGIEELVVTDKGNLVD